MCYRFLSQMLNVAIRMTSDIFVRVGNALLIKLIYKQIKSNFCESVIFWISKFSHLADFELISLI